MENLNDLLSGLSPEDFSRLQAVAQNLLSQSQGAPQSAPQSAPQTADTSAPNIAQDNNVMRALSLLSKAQSEENDVTRFLKSLQPLLSTERQDKVNEALRFLHIMDTLPLLKGLL